MLSDTIFEKNHPIKNIEVKQNPDSSCKVISPIIDSQVTHPDYILEVVIGEGIDKFHSVYVENKLGEKIRTITGDPPITLFLTYDETDGFIGTQIGVNCDDTIPLKTWSLNENERIEFLDDFNIKLAIKHEAYGVCYYENDGICFPLPDPTPSDLVDSDYIWSNVKDVLGIIGGIAGVITIAYFVMRRLNRDVNQEEITD